MQYQNPCWLSRERQPNSLYNFDFQAISYNQEGVHQSVIICAQRSSPSEVSRSTRLTAPTPGRVSRITPPPVPLTRSRRSIFQSSLVNSESITEPTNFWKKLPKNKLVKQLQSVQNILYITKVAERFVLEKIDGKSAAVWVFIRVCFIIYEKLLQEIRKTVDEGTLIDIIAAGFPDFITDRINKE
ncbi:hypothetical protein HW555_002390 [Spodoptera exigua]|uniref:Uncharacterized protein n=1 Tax=Spodoptera exigua TaxID=7107 RepID=A0A835GS71_SPOEX|nr:hypothetical protein HW555_002390 [Spodoptera exigua]